MRALKRVVGGLLNQSLVKLFSGNGNACGRG